jgi:HEAT repeat protein
MTKPTGSGRVRTANRGTCDRAQKPVVAINIERGLYKKGKKAMKGRLKFMGLVAAMLVAAAAFADEASAQNEDSPRPEEELITILQGDGDWMAKQQACRELRHIGTQQCIPALTPLLTDEHLSHMARYAMEDMPFPEVDAALREALNATSGMQKMGVIISLGARGDEEAVAQLSALLADSDENIAVASAGALGRIASKDAVDALLAASGDASGAKQRAVIEGLLAAGRILVSEKDGKQAVRIYEALQGEELPMHARMGAFYGLSYAEPGKAPKRIITALEGDDPMFRGLAAQLVAETSGKSDTMKYAAAVNELPEEGKVALLRGLGTRGDSAAHAAVVASIASDSTNVKLTAIKALGQVGSDADVGMLAPLLISDNADVSAAARLAMRAIPGDEVDAAIAAAVPEAAPDVRAALLGMLTERTAEQAIPLAIQNLNDGDAEVRLAAMRTLVTLGTPAEAPAVITMLTSTTDADERSTAAEALNAIAGIYGDELLPIVLGAVDGANPEARTVLVRNLGQIGSTSALEAVVAAVDNVDTTVSDEAVRVLAGWRSTEAAPHLLTLAQGENASRADQAFRGYVRLAREEGDAAKKAEMLTTAMGMASTQETKWQVLAAWGTLHTPAAIEALKPHLDNPEVQNEAASAIITVATEMGKEEGGRAAARDALNVVISKIKDEAVLDRAQRALEGIPA